MNIGWLKENFTFEQVIENIRNRTTRFNSKFWCFNYLFVSQRFYCISEERTKLLPSRNHGQCHDENLLCLNFRLIWIKHRAGEKLFTVQFRIKKYFSLVSEMSLDLRSQAPSVTSGKYYSVQTSRTANSLYIL